MPLKLVDDFISHAYDRGDQGDTDVPWLQSKG